MARIPSHSRFAVCLCILAVAICVHGRIGPTNGKLFAQGKKKGQEKEQLKAKGTLKGIRGAFMQIEASDGGKWVIKLPQRGNVTYSASADSSWLRPGMYVEFRGTFDEKGRSQSEIRSISVFQPTKENPPGVFAQSSGLPGSKELFKDEPIAEDKNKKATKRPTRSKRKSKSGKFVIKGRLTGVSNSKINVAAGRTLVQARLSEKAQVSVGLPNLRLAQPGDMIEVDGWYPTGRKAAQQAYANRVSVTAANTLTGKKTSRRNKRNEKKSADKDDKKSKSEKKKDPFDGK